MNSRPWPANSVLMMFISPETRRIKTGRNGKYQKCSKLSINYIVDDDETVFLGV